MPTEVVNLKDGDEIAAVKREGRFVFVGRPSIWGNPFSHLPETPKIYRVASKEDAIVRYETWLRGQPALVDRAKRELVGKALACWCIRDPDGSKPVVCHAQVLANLVREFEDDYKAQIVVDKLAGYDPREHGAKCDVCPLKGRHRPVPPTLPSGGPSATKLIIVGEGPGRMEIVEGRPFVGPSGQMVNKMLAANGMSRADCFVTNAACCRGDSDWEKERAAACCGDRLAKELADLPIGAPVLALGAPAAKVMLGRGSILRTRGFVWRLDEVEPSKIRAAEKSLEKRKKQGFAAAIDRGEQSLWRLQARAQFNGRVVIPSIHPAFVLRGGEAMLPMLKVDMRRAVRWAKDGPLKLYDEGEFKVARTKAELIKLLPTLRTNELLIDVETNGPEALLSPMTMFGISEVPNTSAFGLEAEAQRAKNPKLVTPDTLRVVLVSPNIDASTKAGAERLRKTLCEMGAIVHEFIEKTKRTAGGHNFASFDMLVLERYGIKPTRVFDSLIAHHAVASHMRQGLDHLATMYTDCSPWKIAFKTKGTEEKGGMQSKWMASEDLDRYNAADVRLNGIAWRRMQPDLASEMKVYEADMAVAEVCRSMMRAGFQFDDKLAQELSAQLKARAGALLGQMRTLLNKRDFHPIRPGDVREALFGKLQIRPSMITATGLASTASGQLEAIKNPETVAGKLASLILRWRATQKTRATFIEGVHPYSDGRIHPGWKAFGTVTGRLACRGPNIMNLPRWSRALEDRVRELYLAGPGCELIYFDLSQSEMRMAAYQSDDENFIASCEGGDVHTSNAKILFPDARDVLEKDPKGKYCQRHGDKGSAKADCTCGKPFRDVAKNAGFGILYQADSETIFKFLLSKGFSDVTLRDVEAMFAQVHKVYARYYQFCDENMEFCRKHGHLRETFSGRVRWLGWYPAITDVSNYKIQGGIAGIMNVRIIELQKRLPRGARIIAQVHDAVIIEAKKGKVANDTMQVVKTLWLEPIKMPSTGREWVMPIDLKRGERWSDFG